MTTNPFDQGEWVLLQPEGYTTYDFQGRLSTSTCRVRRSQILAVDKIFAPSGKIVVEIAISSAVHPRVMFDPSPEGKRDADLLVEACLGPPRQRMVEVEDEQYPHDKRYVAIDAINSITPHNFEPRVTIDVVESRTVGGAATLVTYRKQFATETEREEFLKLVS